MVLISVFKFIKMKIRYKNIIFGYKFITDKMLPYYYAASDIALIQRKKILNSGNLPLALMMGKVVVAPNIGNISDIMSKINNPTFNPNDIQSLYAAINHAILLSKNNKGEQNKLYAYQEFSIERISYMHLKLYNDILN